MKRNIPIVIAVLSIVIAATGISSAIKATKQRKLAEAESQALRQQIAEMKTRAQRKQTTRTKPIQDTSENTNALVAVQGMAAEPQQERPPRESFAERMARMKEEDPEGYEERVQRRTEMQGAVKYNLAERTATFMDLDTTNMSDAELETHEQLVVQMGSIWELMDQMENLEDGSNRETMRELFTQIQEVRPLMEEERDTMFRMLGEDIGYEGQDAQDFATHIDDIISSTTFQMPRGGGGGSGGGGGGGGGGRGK